MPTRNFIREVCQEEGLTTEELQNAARVVLKALHKAAYCGDESLWGAVIDCRLEFGGEAAYHLGGILELERLQSDKDIPISELFLRLDPESFKKYESLFLAWKDDRTETRKLMDGD